MTDNVRNGLKLYCGAKQMLPPMTQRGSPYQCFRRGFSIGRYITEQKFPQRLQQRTRQIEAASSAMTRRQLADEINKRGLNVLKREIRLRSLRDKDLVRSIARRLHGTANQIDRYWNLSQEALIDELVRRGFNE